MRVGMGHGGGDGWAGLVGGCTALNQAPWEDGVGHWGGDGGEVVG